MRRRITLVLLAVSTALGSGFVAAQTTAHAAGPAPGGLDHFLCYNAATVTGAPTFKIPKGVTLANQFSSTPFKPKFIGWISIATRL